MIMAFAHKMTLISKMTNANWARLCTTVCHYRNDDKGKTLLHECECNEIIKTAIHGNDVKVLRRFQMYTYVSILFICAILINSLWPIEPAGV